jgi:hypothetical protein
MLKNFDVNNVAVRSLFLLLSEFSKFFLREGKALFICNAVYSKTPLAGTNVQFRVAGCE